MPRIAVGTVWLVSTPSAATMPTNGAHQSCQRTRTRAGPSKAMKPQIIAAVPSRPGDRVVERELREQGGGDRHRDQKAPPDRRHRVATKRPGRAAGGG